MGTVKLNFNFYYENECMSPKNKVRLKILPEMNTFGAPDRPLPPPKKIFFAMKNYRR